MRKSILANISIIAIIISLCLLDPLAKAEDKKNIPVIPLSQLLDLEAKMKEGKLKGVKYFDPKKDMKKAEGYYLLYNVDIPLPIGKKVLEKMARKDAEEHNYNEVGRIFSSAVLNVGCTPLFPAVIEKPKMISPEVIEGKNWFVIPGVAKDPKTGERLFPVLQIFNKKRLWKMLYDTADSPEVKIQADDPDEEDLKRYRERLKDGTIFKILSDLKVYPFVSERSLHNVFGDYPYFTYSTKWYTGKKTDPINIGAYLPMYNEEQKRRYPKPITDGDFLFKLIKEGKIGKEDPWYDAIKKGYVKIFEAQDPGYPDQTILLIATPTNVYAYMDGIDENRTRDGIAVLQTDFPKMIETFDEKDGLHAFALFNPSEKAVGVMVYEPSKRSGYFSVFSNGISNGKAVCSEGFHLVILK